MGRKGQFPNLSKAQAKQEQLFSSIFASVQFTMSLHVIFICVWGRSQDAALFFFFLSVKFRFYFRFSIISFYPIQSIIYFLVSEISAVSFVCLHNNGIISFLLTRHN